MGCPQLDAETWQCQLEELLALQSVYDEDFRLLAAPGVGEPLPSVAPLHKITQKQHEPLLEDGCLNLEELLTAGPPQELLTDAGCGDDSGTGGGRGIPGCFVAEVLVHVDVPDGGLQLILEIMQRPLAAPAVVAAKLPPPPPAQADSNGVATGCGSTTSTSSIVDGSMDWMDGPQVLGVDGNDQYVGRDGWVAGPARRRGRGRGGGGGGGKGGGRGGGRGDGGGGGGGTAFESRACNVHGNGPGEMLSGRGHVSGRRGARGGNQRAPSSMSVSTGTSTVLTTDNNDCRGGTGGGGGGNGNNSGPPSQGRCGRGRLGHAGQGLAPGMQQQTHARVRDGVIPPAAAASLKRNNACGVATKESGDDVSATSPSGRDLPAADGGASRPTRNAALFEVCAASPPITQKPEAEAQVAEAMAPARMAGAVSAEQRAQGTGTQVEVPGPSPAPTRVPFGATVQFLSPIRVTLTLPSSYPAAVPPVVDLQALWLSAGQVQVLMSRLQEAWRANGGGGAPTLFLWLDWLRSETLPHLGIRQELVLNTAGSLGMAMELGMVGAAAAAPEGLALSLMRCSARREHEKFNESNISCSICMDEHLGQRCIRLPECRDTFCRVCLATHLQTQLGCGAVDNMRCPAPSCRRQLPPYVLQQLMTPAEYERWETLTLQRTLDKMEDLVYCPRCREPCLEDKDHCTLCPGCFFSFCALCEESWHPGSTCLDPEARLALLEERRSAASQAGGLSATERARQELNRRNELKSLALLAITTKQCPLCSMGVEKTEGCNKMTCAYCGAFFCWKCNQVIQGYDHFQQPLGGEGGCVLFEQQEIDRWNARWEGGPRAAQVELRGAMVEWVRQNDRGVRQCRCVVCGQANVKEGGNNDIRCWSCNSHFCYLCRTWLRTKPGAHFGPGRCKQHTDD